MALDPVAEAAFKKSIREVCYLAFLQLRDTLHQGYNASALGYKSVEDARLQIIAYTERTINKMSAEHLKKHG